MGFTRVDSDDAPCGNERAHDTLRLADHGVQRMPGKAPRSGGVRRCRACIDARGQRDDELTDGATRSTLAQRADRTVAADKVLVF